MMIRMPNPRTMISNPNSKEEMPFSRIFSELSIFRFSASVGEAGTTIFAPTVSNLAGVSWADEWICSSSKNEQISRIGLATMLKWLSLNIREMFKLKKPDSPVGEARDVKPAEEGGLAG